MQHNGFDHGMRHGGGDLDWIPLLVLAIALLGALVVIAYVLAKRRSVATTDAATGEVTDSGRQTPQDILAERLARGEIEPDDYHRRVEALAGPPSPPSSTPAAAD